MRVLTALLLVMLLLGEVTASQLHPRPLKDVVGLARRVFVAKVIEVKVGNPMRYRVEVQNNLRGAQPPGLAQLTYFYPVSEVKLPDGSILRKSLIVNASGHESEPKPGETWIFLSDLEKGEQVFRVEPAASEEALRKLLR